MGLENIESGETPVTAKTQTPKTQSNRFFIVDASECSAQKIQSFITLIQFIRYGNGARITIGHGEDEFDVIVDPEFAKAMAYHISDIIDKLNEQECSEVYEG